MSLLHLQIVVFVAFYSSLKDPVELAYRVTISGAHNVWKKSGLHEAFETNDKTSNGRSQSKDHKNYIPGELAKVP